MTSATRRVLFLVASARRSGNGEMLARRAEASLPAGTACEWIHLQDVPLPPFVDHRHAPGSDGTFPPPAGNEARLLDATLAATDLVFVAPLYWYGLPASAKLYLDYWTAWMRVPGREFRARMAGKTAWAITALSDEDPATAEPLLQTLRLSARYLEMRWGGHLLGYGSRPGDVLADAETLAAADAFFGDA
jgi:NAD(P)H-dependent FMN reductase